MTKLVSDMVMHDFLISNVDTDSASFCKPDMSPFSEEEQEALLQELNSFFPDRISWEHDGIYDVFVIVKAKNYILYDGKKVKIKGSSLVASMKEVALKEFINEVINCLVFDRQDEIIEVYYKYVREIFVIQDMKRWCSRKTITESVLNPKRATEQKILDAVGNRKVQMGDKIQTYFKVDGTIGICEDWNNDHDTQNLLSKLYNTVKIFTSVIKIEEFKNFALKSHQIACDLADVLGQPHPEKQKRTKKLVSNT